MSSGDLRALVHAYSNTAAARAAAATALAAAPRDMAERAMLSVDATLRETERLLARMRLERDVLARRYQVMETDTGEFDAATTGEIRALRNTARFAVSEFGANAPTFAYAMDPADALDSSVGTSGAARYGSTAATSMPNVRRLDPAARNTYSVLAHNAFRAQVAELPDVTNTLIEYVRTRIDGDAMSRTYAVQLIDALGLPCRKDTEFTFVFKSHGYEIDGPTYFNTTIKITELSRVGTVQYWLHTIQFEVRPEAPTSIALLNSVSIDVFAAKVKLATLQFLPMMLDQDFLLGDELARLGDVATTGQDILCSTNGPQVATAIRNRQNLVLYEVKVHKDAGAPVSSYSAVPTFQTSFPGKSILFVKVLDEDDALAELYTERTRDADTDPANWVLVLAKTLTANEWIVTLLNWSTAVTRDIHTFGAAFTDVFASLIAFHVDDTRSFFHLFHPNADGFLQMTSVPSADALLAEGVVPEPVVLVIDAVRVGPLTAVNISPTRIVISNGAGNSVWLLRLSRRRAPVIQHVVLQDETVHAVVPLPLKQIQSAFAFSAGATDTVLYAFMLPYDAGTPELRYFRNGRCVLTEYVEQSIVANCRVYTVTQNQNRRLLLIYSKIGSDALHAVLA